MAFGISFIPSAKASGNQAKVSFVSTNMTSVIKTGSKQTVSWKTENFPKGAKLNVNLIHKVSDSPARYELERQVSKETANDGSETWSANRHEIGSNLLIEVTCGNPVEFKGGCTSNTDNKIFAVKGTFGENFANSFDGFMNLFR